MRFSISNIAWGSEQDETVYAMMQKYGFTGLEIAPTRWVQEQPYSRVEKAITISNKLKKEKDFVIPSMQSIWYGRSEKLFASSTERKELLLYTKSAIDYAKQIDCHNLVFGCPRNRVLPEGMKDDVAIPFFKELGDYAFEQGTVLSMEANPTIYNTNYINTTDSALNLIKRVNSKGFLLNLDMGTMIQNEEAVSLIDKNVNLINHVHISEPGLQIIKRRTLHTELASVLKACEYNNFVSIELGKQESLQELENAMVYVKEVFE